MTKKDHAKANGRIVLRSINSANSKYHRGRLWRYIESGAIGQQAVISSNSGISRKTSIFIVPPLRDKTDICLRISLQELLTPY
jgi:hypothetical protein